MVAGTVLVTAVGFEDSEDRFRSPCREAASIFDPNHIGTRDLTNPAYEDRGFSCLIHEIVDARGQIPAVMLF